MEGCQGWQKTIQELEYISACDAVTWSQVSRTDGTSVQDDRGVSLGEFGPMDSSA